MHGKANGLASYGRIANTTLDPLSGIIALYDGAIRFLRAAAVAIEANDLPAKAEHTNRAFDIIIYLQSILDFERGGEAAPVLDALYASVTAIALRASAQLDAAGMNRAADLLTPVREAWASAAQAAPAAASPTATLPPSVFNSGEPARAEQSLFRGAA